MENSQKLQEWFGLSHASFCVLPRSLMESMPKEWQDEIAKLLNEYDDEFDTSDIGVDKVIVSGLSNGRFCRIPDFIKNYKHKDFTKINSIRNT